MDQREIRAQNKLYVRKRIIIIIYSTKGALHLPRRAPEPSICFYPCSGFAWVNPKTTI